MDFENIYGMANEGASELIEDDYYDDEQDMGGLKKQRISNLDQFDDELNHSQSVPAFDQLPSVRSRMSEHSYNVNLVNGLTDQKLKMFENTPRDFDNLPSMQDSEYTGGK